MEYLSTKHTFLKHINDGSPGVVCGEAIPGVAWVQEPLLYVTVIFSCISWTCSLNGQAVEVWGSALKLQSGVVARLLHRTAVPIAEHSVMADREHALPFTFSLRAGHVPWHREARVFGGLRGYAAAQTDWSIFRHRDVWLGLLHLQFDGYCEMTESGEKISDFTSKRTGNKRQHSYIHRKKTPLVYIWNMKQVITFDDS